MNPFDSLWKFDVRDHKFVTPKRVMRAQAEHLSQMSDGALRVKVQTSPGKGVRSGLYVHEFKVGTTEPLSYEYTLLEVRQTVDIYPLQIVSEAGDTVECNHLEEFVEALGKLLNAASTQRRLNALFSQVVDDLDADPGSTRATPTSSGQATSSDETLAVEPAATTDQASTPVAESATTSEPEAAAANEGESIRGDMTVAELNRRFQLKLNPSDYPTVGQYVHGELGHLPRAGVTLTVKGAVLEVETMSGRSVGTVKVFPQPGEA